LHEVHHPGIKKSPPHKLQPLHCKKKKKKKVYINNLLQTFIQIHTNKKQNEGETKKQPKNKSEFQIPRTTYQNLELAEGGNAAP